MAKINAVTLSVADRETVNRRVQAAATGRGQGAHISFASVDLLWRVLTKKRWGLIQALTNQGPMTIREAARRVGRDFKGVHTDVHALLEAGIIDRQDDGLIVFPYQAVHVDFVLRAA